MAPLSNVDIATNIGEILSRVSSAISDSPVVDMSKQFACDAAYVTKKLLRSTGKAAWIAGTHALILVVPLMIQIERHAEFDELASLYGNSPPYTSLQ